MDGKQALRMNPGEGETSFARNSAFQSARQNGLKPLIEEAIRELYCKASPLPESISIADLGCSSGPNAIALVSTAVDAIRHRYLQLDLAPPELSLHFNDLHSNDFNTVLKHLAEFQDRLKVEKGAPIVRTSIVPGSFYGLLFAAGSMDLFLSSSRVHWLSQAPEGLVKNGIPMYHADENIWKKRRPAVLDAYAQQFRKDFMLLLASRAQEMAPGGKMVLSLSATNSSDPADGSTQVFEFVALILDDMASRGVFDKEKLNTFYFPLYEPHEREVTEIIEEQGSFSISKVEVHDSFSGMNKALINPKMIANALRAVCESIISNHSGSAEEILDEFVMTVEQYISVASYSRKPHVLCLSLSRKS